jgi:hypothetical protein
MQTDGLRHIRPFGLNTFYKSFSLINGGADQIVLTVKKATDLALPSDHCSL